MRYDNEIDETALFQSNDNMNQAFADRLGLSLDDTFAYVYGLLNSKEYQEYCKVNMETDYNFIINYLKDKGFEITREMIDTYEKWESAQYDTYYLSIIEEVELV